MARAFLGAAQDVHVSMRNGVVSVSKGIAAMNRLMDEALSALGIEGGSHANLKQKKQAVQLAQEYPKAHLEIEGSGATIETAVKGAQGGVWQVGNPGEAGRDTVPLNVGGMPIVVAPGEQVVVFNRHQIPEANERFADYGGLPGFFAAHQRPNYMAAGGIAAPATHLGGALGDLAGGELRRVAAAMNRMLARVTPGAPGRSGWGAASANEALGRQMMLAAGWPVSEWPYLQKLWQRESGWNAYAMNNPSMGWLAAGNASGIPQADGHGYVFAPGDARAQIAWGLADIRSVYGSPRAAWAHELAHGWYAGGGLVRGGAWGAMARRLDAAAQRRYKPTAMNFRPFATIPSLKTMPGAFNHGLSTLNALLGSHGSVASLQERYSDAERADSLTPAGSEEFVVEGPEGSAHLNMAAIEARLAQLEHLAHLQVLVHGDLHHALGLVGRLEHTITRAIAYRRKQVAKIKARIQKIRAAIRARARLMKTLEHRIAQDQQKLGHLYGKAHAGERHAVHGEIHALRGELHAAHGAQHSDEATRQHLEHNLGILGAQDRSLHERASALSEDRWGIIGASKHGGTLGESSYALAQLAQQMQPLREATRGGGPLAAQVAKALAEGVGGYEGYGSAQENREQLSASLKEQNERLQQELFVSQQQYKVFAALPPFGGTFHSGGIVPGPVGAERLALVKGGEVISPGGSPSKLEVHVLDGAVDPNKIAVIADGVVQQHTRQAGRAFNTPLPSRGGGW